MKKPKFKIGDWVSIAATASFEYDDKNHKQVVRTETRPWIGQIVGAKRKQTGWYDPGYSGGYWDEEKEAPSFTIDRTITVWLVTRGLVNIPLMCLEDDLIIVPEEAKPESLPWLCTVQPEWDEVSRKEYRDAVKDCPRDSKGRFLKDEPTRVP